MVIHVALTVHIQEAKEREFSAGRSSGSSEIMKLKIATWHELAADLQIFLQAQIDRLERGKELAHLDISEICDLLDMQQGALKNKMRGYAVQIVRSGRRPNYTYTASVRWIQDKADRLAYRDEVNAYMATLDKDAPRLMGGLGLYRTFSWLGKDYPIEDKTEYDRQGEPSKKFYVLGIGKYWRGANPTGRSN